jgi:hypothetical protein
MAMEEIFRANPGMRETYRAYGHEMHAKDVIGRMHVKRAELLARSDVDGEEVQEQLKQVQETLRKAIDALEKAHAEIIACLRNEQVLRAQMELVR